MATFVTKTPDYASFFLILAVLGFTLDDILTLHKTSENFYKQNFEENTEILNFGYRHFERDVALFYQLFY